MDRRQRKSREAIFSAFTELLSKKDYRQITVGEIIEKADVGRTTFYAHFETKDYLLKELCRELFCHLFDSIESNKKHHRHIFDCKAPDSVFLHLFQHLYKDDNHILSLLSCQNNELFLQYFKSSLVALVENQLALFPPKKGLPRDFWIDHIAATFVQTLKWWIANGVKETPETITEYFFLAV